MKPYGDCCTVALRKQRQLLLQHMTKPSLSDRPSQAGAAAPPLLEEKEEEEVVLNPLHISLVPGAVTVCWVSGGPSPAALPPPFQPSCNTGDDIDGWHTRRAGATAASTSAHAKRVVHVSSGGRRSRGRREGGPAVASLTGRPRAVQERYVF